MKKAVGYIIASLLIICSAVYGWFTFNYGLDITNNYLIYFLSGSIIIISLIIAICLIVETARKKSSGGYLIISLVSLSIMIASSLNFAGIYQLPEQETVPDFYNKTLVEVQEWAQGKNIELTTSYENSDTILKYSVMAQDVAAGIELKKVTTIGLVVSDGPNYDKSVIVPNMLGWALDDVITYVKQNFLSNVNISFTNSSEGEYTVISQDKYGEMQRKAVINITIAYNTETLKPQTMINMSGYSQFDAELWFKKYGIPYKLSSDFSETIERGIVLSVSVSEGQEVSKDTDISLIISKGKEIEVPDLITMSVEEVTKWVVNNNLNISFLDAYDDKIELGKIISANYKPGDMIEEQTTINIVISKGPVTMQKFSSLGAFKNWANTYGISYTTKSEFSSTVPAGGVISYSYSEGQVIPNGASITVTVSKGKAITVPNFKGLSKASVTSKCNSLGLYCSFKYGGYSSTAADVAISQSVSSGSTVASGTAVTITLSLGPAKSYTVYFTAAQLGNTYQETVNSLNSYFASNYPGVTFKFEAKASSSLRSGQISPDSPIKPGISVTQGKTYYVYVVK